MVVHKLSNQNPDGSELGESATDLVGFYGSTPVVQPSTASQDAVTATAVTATNTTASITTAAHGFADGTQADALITRVAQLQVDMAATIILANQVRADLTTLGLIKGAV